MFSHSTLQKIYLWVFSFADKEKTGGDWDAVDTEERDSEEKDKSPAEKPASPSNIVGVSQDVRQPAEDLSPATPDDMPGDNADSMLDGHRSTAVEEGPSDPVEQLVSDAKPHNETPVQPTSSPGESPEPAEKEPKTTAKSSDDDTRGKDHELDGKNIQESLPGVNGSHLTSNIPKMPEVPKPSEKEEPTKPSKGLPLFCSILI